MANKVNFLPTTDTPQGNDIIRLVGHNTTIVGNRAKWSKSTFSFLIKFVSIRNLCNRANQHLRRKFKRRLIDVVDFVMELEIIKDTFRPSDIRNSVADRIGFTNSFEKQFSLFSSRKKFDFQRQFHNANIQNNFLYLKIIINKRRNLGQFLPLPKGEGVSLPPI